MTDVLIVGLVVIFGLTSVLGAVSLWAVHSRKYGRYRMRTPVQDPLPAGRKYLNMSLNGTLSLSFYAACLYFGSRFLVHDETPVPVLWFGEVMASLLLYDLAYYAMHRAFHRPRMMKWVHGVHHKVHYPTAMDGLYLNPVENMAGLSLLMLSIAAVGPISVASFLTVALLHSFVNIVTHTNLMLPHPAFRLTNYWALKHDHHHGEHRNANFATIFPFWDMMFGTYR